MNRMIRRAAALLVGGASLLAMAAEVPPPREVQSSIAPASDEGERAMAGFKLASGLKATLFAAEPSVANIVAIHPDEKGRWFVVETFRVHKGVGDIRGLMKWLDDDLAARTVEDRIRMHFKHEGDKAKDRTHYSDRLRLVEDTDGDGKADKATVFSDGYNDIADGIASGVLARRGEVYFANLPHLWRLRDTNGDGVADLRRSLQHGYGVRVGFLGHDLHGLRFGPDGKLYFTVGDRGLNVTTERGRLEYPDAGAVLRCDADGSNLELFATGLRNPQELAFDHYGNLFTGDNNCDKGDPAKWYHLLEGGDGGWRVGYQHLPDGGPWNAEKLHATASTSTAAYLVPPIAHIGNGPSGVTFYPGTGLPEKYDGHFLMADFKGSPSTSGIYSFAMKPKGASFEVVNKEQFAWNILATDVEFGPDGGVFISDWVNGWGMPMKGRIYRITDPAAATSAIVAETRRLIAEGMEKRSGEELAALLAHADQRIRQEAQFALAARGEQSAALLERIAREQINQFARIHAVWALGQIGRKSPAVLARIVPLLNSADLEVRAQAAKVLGDARHPEAFDGLLPRLADPSPRVQLHAAIALGKLGRREAAEPLLDMLARNDDRDPHLRHAGVMGLVGCADPADLAALPADAPRARQVAAVLALRRLRHPGVANFLRRHFEPSAEAARAIYDEQIDEAMDALAETRLVGAAFRTPTDQSNFRILQRRAIHANYRLGTAESARRLAAFAAETSAPAELRAESLHLLAAWEKPRGQDRIVGLWRPLPQRQWDSSARDEVARMVVALLEAEKTPDDVRVAALGWVEKYPTPGVALLPLATSADRPQDVRIAALRAMEARKDPALAEAVKAGLLEKSGRLRREAIRVSMRLPDGARQLDSILEQGSAADQQAVFNALAGVDAKAADQTLTRWMDRMLEGKVPAEVRLDLLDAASRSRSPAVREKLIDFEKARSRFAPKGYDLVKWSECLTGGDAEAGKQVFLNKQEVSCTRCHSIGGDAPLAGPDLKGIASRQSREYLLESILQPHKKVAQGYEMVMVRRKGKRAIVGTLKQETPDELVLLNAEDNTLVRIRKTDIEKRDSQSSSMPEGMDQHLSKRELRDLVEFLANQ